MGKNFQGGKKAKSMARKNGNLNKNDVPVIISPEEEYAVVTAVSGNGRFRVCNKNGTTYVAVLPGAMRGRRKRSNYVGSNTFLLINNRSSWQTLKPLCHVDVDHVYSEQQAQQLQLHALFREYMNKGFSDRLAGDNNNVQFSNVQDVQPVQITKPKQIEDDEDDDDDIVLNNDFDLDLI